MHHLFLRQELDLEFTNIKELRWTFESSRLDWPAYRTNSTSGNSVLGPRNKPPSFPRRTKLKNATQKSTITVIARAPSIVPSKDCHSAGGGAPFKSSFAISGRSVNVLCWLPFSSI